MTDRHVGIVVAAGALAGCAVGLWDAFQAHQVTLPVWFGAALLALDAGAGVLLAMAALGLWRLSHFVSTQLPFRAPTSGLMALLLALIAIPLGRRIFSGAGVSRTLLGTIGPWTFPVLVGIAAWIYFVFLVRLWKGGARLRQVHAGVCIALGTGMIVLERQVLPGQYEYLHTIGALSGVVVIGFAMATFIERRLSSRLGVAGAMVALSLAAIAAQIIPIDNAQREFFATTPSVAKRVAALGSWAIDLDGDGESPILNGRDCDDFDPEVGSFRAEIEGNGRDENCDGEDFIPKPEIEETYRVDRAHAQTLSAKARGRPTVFIVIDALRYDRANSGNYPNLNRLTTSAIHFTSAWAPSASTANSVPAIVTGRLMPTRHHKSVFEHLKARGRRTAVVAPDIVLDSVTGHANAARLIEYPFLRGFDEVATIPTGPRDARRWGGGVQVSTDAQVTDRAFSLLDRAQPPDVLWVHYFDLHQWMDLSGLKSEGTARYDEALQSIVDRELGRWLARGDSVNLLFLSDHGEGLGDQGVLTHTKFLTKAVARVPLWVRIPGVAPAKVQTPVSLIELPSTLLDMLGLAPDGSDEARRSLLGLVGVSDPGFRPIRLIESAHLSIIRGRYRLLVDQHTNASWLFDIIADPAEQRSIASQHAALADKMLRDIRQLNGELTNAYRSSLTKAP